MRHSILRHGALWVPTYFYDHEASLGVDSMNQANKPARDRASVDVVNATMLLLQMERYVINLRNIFILQQC